jgi:hypothetical protein
MTLTLSLAEKSSQKELFNLRKGRSGTPSRKTNHDLKVLLSGADLKEGRVQARRRRHSAPNGLHSGWSRNHPENGREKAVCRLVAARCPESLIGRALAHNYRYVFASHINLDEPVVFVVAGSANQAKVGLER